jgi:hypothetical protein
VSSPNIDTDNTDEVVIDTAMQSRFLPELTTKAAAAGYQLQKLASGFLLQRWGNVIHCVDLDGVAAQLSRMGAL